jgi:hypothetical protein
MSRRVDENYMLLDEEDTCPDFTAEVDRLQEIDDKNAWIQKAKALFLDLLLCGDVLRDEIRDMINEGGGYDPECESSRTELKWKKQVQVDEV